MGRALHRAVVVAAAATMASRAVALAQQPVPRPPVDTAVPAALAFQGTTVIDVATGRRLPNQTIVVVGNRIRAVGPTGRTPLPAGTRVRRADGTFVIPGLWDMHVHVDDHADRFYPRFISQGVTGIREMAQRFPDGADSFRLWQRQVMDGQRVGPRSYGPSVDLSQGNGLEIHTAADEARH